MKRTYSVKFYCKKSAVLKDGTAPVEVSLIYNGERLQWQLPRKCRPELFSKDEDLQAYCTTIKNRLNKIHTNLEINNEVITAYRIKDIFLNGNEHKSYTIQNLFDDGLRVKKAERRAISTYRKYELVADRFCPRTGLNPNMEAGRVTVTDVLNFKSGAESEHSPVTVFKELKHLKYFFKIAFESGKIKSNPFATYKIKAVALEKPYLEYSEVLKLKTKLIASDRLDKARDLFLFLCFSGLEWADLVNLKKEDIKKNSIGQLYIKKPRVKTNIEYVSVLYEDAVDLWDFYKGELPIVSPQKFNKNIKDVAKLVGIDKEISSLTARHTYACYLLNQKKLPIDVVSKMLGHNSTIQTKHYAKMFAETVFEANKGRETPKRRGYSYMEYIEDKKMLDAFESMFNL